MKNLINVNQTNFMFDLMTADGLEEFKELCTLKLNYDEDDVKELIYGKDGLLDLKLYDIFVSVDWGALEIVSISKW